MVIGGGLEPDKRSIFDFQVETNKKGRICLGEEKKGINYELENPFDFDQMIFQLLGPLVKRRSVVFIEGYSFVCVFFLR